ncbi:type II toxin-antitoxin system VapC family toxin [Archaeoglobus sp.]
MYSKDRVFVDSNVIVGFFSGNSKAVEVLDNFSDCILCINDVVFSEVAYKLMVLKFLEKNEKFRLHALRKDISDHVHVYEILWEFISRAEMEVLQINEKIIAEAIEIGVRYGLLPNDALIAATCKHYGIKKIATFDDDFKRVDFLEVVEV